MCVNQRQSFFQKGRLLPYLPRANLHSTLILELNESGFLVVWTGNKGFVKLRGDSVLDNGYELGRRNCSQGLGHGCFIILTFEAQYTKAACQTFHLSDSLLPGVDSVYPFWLLRFHGIPLIFAVPARCE